MRVTVHVTDQKQENANRVKVKQNIQLVNVRTSIVLEAAIWDAIGEILDRENLDLYVFAKWSINAVGGITLPRRFGSLL